MADNFESTTSIGQFEVDEYIKDDYVSGFLEHDTGTALFSIVIPSVVRADSMCLLML